mmetsp:Transcript_73001/g.144689  ORF Transcript_73001/g.144689 Transcript_73001/m.144689 type:complete len:219 (+) Transcript_73001:1239-1895(+)
MCCISRIRGRACTDLFFASALSDSLKSFSSFWACASFDCRSNSNHRFMELTTTGMSRSNCTSVCLGEMKLLRTSGTGDHHPLPTILSQKAFVHGLDVPKMSMRSVHAGGHCNICCTTTWKSIRKFSLVNSRPYCSTWRASISSPLFGKQKTEGRPLFIAQASVKTLSMALRQGGPPPRPPPSPGMFIGGGFFFAATPVTSRASSRAGRQSGSGTTAAM